MMEVEMKDLKKALTIAGAAGALLGTLPVEARAFLQDPFDVFALRPKFLMLADSTGISMYEKEGKVYIEAPLPGVNEKDVSLTLDDRTLSITGSRNEKQEEGAEYYYQSSGNFNYRVTLPQHVDLAAPQASFKNGLMTVVFDNKKEPEPRKIEFTYQS